MYISPHAVPCKKVLIVSVLRNRRFYSINISYSVKRFCGIISENKNVLGIQISIVNAFIMCERNIFKSF